MLKGSCIKEKATVEEKKRVKVIMKVQEYVFVFTSLFSTCWLQ